MGTQLRIMHYARSAPAGGENPQGFHPYYNREISAGQAEHRHAAAVLTLWVRNAAAWRCSACQGRYRIGEEMNKRMNNDERGA
jgi:hypothetical protein